MYNQQSRLLLQIYSPLLKSDFYFSYMGNYSDSLTGLLSDMMLYQLSKREELKKTSIKRAVFLATESFQNIIRYRLEDRVSQNRKTVNFDGFQLFIKGETIVISSMNKVETEVSVDLNSVLEELRKLTKDELKERWKNQLAEGIYTQGGGGGLGLIEMARKTDEPLDFKFWKISSSRALFRLNLILGQTTASHFNAPISKVLDDLAFDQLSEETILAIKGHLTTTSFEHLLNFIQTFFETEGKNEDDELRIKIVRALTNGFEEFGFNDEGFVKGYFVMGRQNKGYYIACGYPLNGNNDAWTNEKNLQLLQKNCLGFDFEKTQDSKGRNLVNIISIMK